MQCERGRLLLGAFESADAAVQFAAHVRVVDVSCIRESWRAARDAFLATPVEQTEPWGVLDPELVGEAAERMRAPLFQAALDGKRWEVRAACVASLRVVQPLVRLGWLDKMSAKISQDIVGTLFPLETSLPVAAQKRDGGAIILTDRPELAVSSVSLRQDGATGALEVTLRVEPRPNYVSATTLAGAVVLRNGHHRLLAAMRAGFACVPCVVVDAPVPSRAYRLPTEVVTSTRPPVLADFAREWAATIEVVLRPRHFATIICSKQQTIHT